MIQPRFRQRPRFRKSEETLSERGCHRSHFQLFFVTMVTSFDVT